MINGSQVFQAVRFLKLNSLENLFSRRCFIIIIIFVLSFASTDSKDGIFLRFMKVNSKTSHDLYLRKSIWLCHVVDLIWYPINFQILLISTQEFLYLIEMCILTIIKETNPSNLSLSREYWTLELPIKDIHLK